VQNVRSIRSFERGIDAFAGLLLAPLVLLCIAGCATAGSREKLPVSVSAANYSQLTDEELYNALNAPIAIPTVAPPVLKPSAMHHYLVVPGEVYPNDVPMDIVYREVELVLEKRGYFNAEYERRAGLAPAATDYIMRIHYGKRPWLTPTVRADRITWGNDGLVSNRYRMGLLSDPLRDEREGMTSDDMVGTRRMLAALGGGFGMGKKSNGPAALAYQQLNQGIAGAMAEKLSDARALDFYLIVVEAFRFDDVERMNRKAHCVWTVFIAVPADQGKKFSDVLRGMLQAAIPYFGETTHGIQIQEVPPGKVTLGEPKAVP